MDNSHNIASLSTCTFTCTCTHTRITHAELALVSLILHTSHPDLLVRVRTCVGACSQLLFSPNSCICCATRPFLTRCARDFFLTPAFLLDSLSFGSGSLRVAWKGIACYSFSILLWLVILLYWERYCIVSALPTHSSCTAPRYATLHKSGCFAAPSAAPRDICIHVKERGRTELTMSSQRQQDKPAAKTTETKTKNKASSVAPPSSSSPLPSSPQRLSPSPRRRDSIRRLEQKIRPHVPSLARATSTRGGSGQSLQQPEKEKEKGKEKGGNRRASRRWSIIPLDFDTGTAGADSGEV